MRDNPRARKKHAKSAKNSLTRQNFKISGPWSAQVQKNKKSAESGENVCVCVQINSKVEALFAHAHVSFRNFFYQAGAGNMPEHMSHTKQLTQEEHSRTQTFYIKVENYMYWK